MEHIEKLKDAFPDAARDIKINLGNVLGTSSLSVQQVWGTAVACAYAARHPALTAAILAQARHSGIEDGVLEDAKAAAIAMGMNNVLYRFRHVIGKEEYTQKPARLRMQRLAQVTSDKASFELFCLAVSAINDCQACEQSHEAKVLENGLTSDQVFDAIRIASTIHASAIALEVAATP